MDHVWQQNKFMLHLSPGILDASVSKSTIFDKCVIHNLRGRSSCFDNRPVLIPQKIVKNAGKLPFILHYGDTFFNKKVKVIVWLFHILTLQILTIVLKVLAAFVFQLYFSCSFDIMLKCEKRWLYSSYT